MELELMVYLIFILHRLVLVGGEGGQKWREEKSGDSLANM
jgi:hypothetical protein